MATFQDLGFLLAAISVVLLLVAYILRINSDQKIEPGSDMLKPCPNCGADKVGRKSELEAENNEVYYCGDCGYNPNKSEVYKSFSDFVNEVSDNSQTEISHPELRKQVEDRKEEGWKIEEVTHSGDRVIMSTTEGGTIGGHALTGFLTGISTFGLGNVAYSKLSKKKNKERIVLRADDKSDTETKIEDDEDAIKRIRELKRLHEDGIITEKEFDKKKEELLKDL